VRWRHAFALPIGLLGCAFEPSTVVFADADADARGSDGGGALDGAPDGGADANPFAIRYNLAGAEHVGVDFPGTWAADPGTVCGGATWTVTGDVHNTVDDALFLRYRYSSSPLDCAVVVPSGTYQVNVVLAEVYEGPGCDSGSAGTNARDFTIEVEGVLRFSNVDPFEEGEGCAVSTISTTGHPIVKSVTETIDDGTVDVRLTPSYGYAMISALEIAAE
jgi:hypothetical protein